MKDGAKDLLRRLLSREWLAAMAGSALVVWIATSLEIDPELAKMLIIAVGGIAGTVIFGRSYAKRLP